MIILLSFTLFSHVGLFENLSGREGFQDQSVIRNTWSLFWLEMRGEIPPADLGGGMIGAVAFAVSHFLFAEGGTYFLCIVLFLSGLILLTGRSITEILGRFFRKGYIWLSESMKTFFGELKQWKLRTKERLNEERISHQEKKKNGSVQSSR